MKYTRIQSVLMAGALVSATAFADELSDIKADSGFGSIAALNKSPLGTCQPSVESGQADGRRHRVHLGRTQGGRRPE